MHMAHQAPEPLSLVRLIVVSEFDVNESTHLATLLAVAQTASNLWTAHAQNRGCLGATGLWLSGQVVLT